AATADEPPVALAEEGVGPRCPGGGLAECPLQVRVAAAGLAGAGRTLPGSLVVFVLSFLRVGCSCRVWFGRRSRVRRWWGRSIRGRSRIGSGLRAAGRG